MHIRCLLKFLSGLLGLGFSYSSILVEQFVALCFGTKRVEEDEIYRDPPSTFEQNYRCYPVSFIEKSHLEKGDKTYLQIDYPMLFELKNPSASKVSHCGVLEFIADEGLIYIPYWMMENMLLQEGDIVNVKNASLSKGTYVKLQPHTTDFLDISNPKAMLVLCCLYFLYILQYMGQERRVR
ncbi:putative ubiquitin fusion degradation protein Ufd1 [Helianthus annuus]|nr:putative ubiquitin fusion degradation protein Ufd1 [Helianthus annuus]